MDEDKQKGRSSTALIDVVANTKGGPLTC